MLRKVFRTGNSVVVSLPRDALELLGIGEGSEVSIDLDRENRQILITLHEGPLAVWESMRLLRTKWQNLSNNIDLPLERFPDDELSNCRTGSLCACPFIR